MLSWKRIEPATTQCKLNFVSTSAPSLCTRNLYTIDPYIPSLSKCHHSPYSSVPRITSLPIYHSSPYIIATHTPALVRYHSSPYTIIPHIPLHPINHRSPSTIALHILHITSLLIFWLYKSLKSWKRPTLIWKSNLRKNSDFFVRFWTIVVSWTLKKLNRNRMIISSMFRPPSACKKSSRTKLYLLNN